MSTKLFVTNLAPGVTRRRLEELFSTAGFEVTANVPLDRQTGRTRGFAFVSLGTREAAEDALIELAGVQLDDRPLRLEWARETEDRGVRSGARHPRRDGRSEPARPGARSVSSGNQPEADDYVEKHRSRQRRGSRHGSDRLRGHGTRRRID